MLTNEEMKYFKAQKAYHKLEMMVNRCTEIIGTGALFDGGRNPLTQSAFIEMMLLLASLKTYHAKNCVSDVTDIRNGAAHFVNWKKFDFGNGLMVVGLARNYQGSWAHDVRDRSFVPTSEECDIEYSWGQSKIKYSEIVHDVRGYQGLLLEKQKVVTELDASLRAAAEPQG